MIIIDKVFFIHQLLDKKEVTILPGLRKPASVQAIYEDISYQKNERNIKVLKSVGYQYLYVWIIQI